MILIRPTGRIDQANKSYWNTGPNNCCHATSTEAERDDDGQYLLSLLDEISSKYNVNKKKVYFSGHSNGSFMSLYMACNHADRVTAISGNAGALPADKRF